MWPFWGIASKRGYIILCMYLYKKRKEPRGIITLLLMENSFTLFRKSHWSTMIPPPRAKHCHLSGHRKGVSPCPWTWRADVSVKAGNFSVQSPHNLRVNHTNSLWRHSRAVSHGSGFRAACETKTNKVSLPKSCQQQSHTILTIMIMRIIGTAIKGYHKGRSGGREKMDPTTWSP